MPTKKAKKTTADIGKEQKLKATAGKAIKGVEFNTEAEAFAAAAVGIAELKEPRPYKSRYPISEEDFQKLKSQAAKTKQAKGKVVAAPDKKTLGPEAAAAPVAPLALAEAPALAPAIANNFAAIPSTGWIPPDCTMATGISHIVASVNSSVAVYDKNTGAQLLLRTLTVWFSNVVQGLTIFDPKVLYDQHNGRFVLLAVAFRQNPNQSVFLLSVSSTSNPLGSWRNYVFNAMVDGTTATNNWADYPGLGVDNQAIYVTANMFQFGGNFQYAKIRVIPKAGPYSGGPAPFFDFVKMRNADNTLAFTIQPCHTFGAPLVEYLVNSLYPSGNKLTLWRIQNPTVSPTLTRSVVATSQYSLPPNANQKGGGLPLNTGDVRIQHAVFRGGSVWTSLTTVRNWGTGNRASIHWFQINAGASALTQEGVYGASGFHYFYPAACPDTNGNMVMVFSRCGTTQFGSIHYTGRRSTDPLGSLQGSALLKAGVANYVATDSSGRNRWGDYNGVASDPVNGRVVWFYSEYASALNTWGTWIGSAAF
jgi:hypothetical protein